MKLNVKSFVLVLLGAFLALNVILFLRGGLGNRGTGAAAPDPPPQAVAVDLATTKVQSPRVVATGSEGTSSSSSRNSGGGSSGSSSNLGSSSGSSSSSSGSDRGSSSSAAAAAATGAAAAAKATAAVVPDAVRGAGMGRGGARCRQRVRVFARGHQGGCELARPARAGRLWSLG